MMTSFKGDRIEILSVDLLDRFRPLVMELRETSARLGHELGWHYLLDLAWILENLGDPRDLRILDAGAGMGVLQWYLIEHKASLVISVDRADRSAVGLGLRARYDVRGLRPADLRPARAMVTANMQAAHGVGKATTALRGLAALMLGILPKTFPGRLVFYHQDLAAMSDIADDSLDAAVAVSALEHNDPESLPAVVDGIMRKIRPGGKLLATLGTVGQRDWYHVPSRGWNYSDTTLIRLFNLALDTPSNYDRFDALFTALMNCAELRDNLSEFYFKSGDNGMPWGKWDPQYMPVGVCKIKPGST